MTDLRIQNNTNMSDCAAWLASRHAVPARHRNEDRDQDRGRKMFGRDAPEVPLFVLVTSVSSQQHKPPSHPLAIYYLIHPEDCRSPECRWVPKPYCVVTRWRMWYSALSSITLGIGIESGGVLGEPPTHISNPGGFGSRAEPNKCPPGIRHLDIAVPTSFFLSSILYSRGTTLVQPAAIDRDELTTHHPIYHVYLRSDS